MTPPVVVIGGGPAGCAAAIALCRGGERPIVIERSAGPAHKVCGDFLGPDTVARLRALGVDPVRLGAVPVARVRLFQGRRAAEAALPFAALSLSRRTLDAALLGAARDAGATLALGRGAGRVTQEGEGWTVEAGTAVAARAVVLATGKHDLRGRPRPLAQGGAVGLKTYLDLDAGEATELTLFPGGYAGLQATDQGAALCIAVARDAFRAAGGTWDGLLAAIGASCPAFADRILGARPLLDRPLAVAGVPYGHLHRDSGDGLFRAGDQAAVIPSLTGDGMAIALETGTRAGLACLDGESADRFHRAQHRALAGQMRLAGLLHAAFLSPVLQPAVVSLAARLPGLSRLAARRTRLRAPGPGAGPLPGSATAAR